ncbi:MAG: CAAD domain-containing protein [Leptolyngbyaceae bacterium]|nr:CAAD domain-containing protein [Leptolyngbyaceae bacterium]
MNPELQQSEYSEPTPEAQKVELNVNVEGAGTLAKLPPASESSTQWRQIGERISLFLADLPDYLSEFFGEYKRPLITLGLILGGVVSVKLTLAILDAINDIPLLAPVFELIGIGYGTWFIYRYLLRASNRQELGDDIQAFKEQILGNKLPND